MIAVLAILSGILYRLGGVGDPFWTKDRDIGCSILVCILLYILGLANDCKVILTFLICWGALSTYHKWINPIFKKPKDDSFWFNWLLHGFFIGISLPPCLYPELWLKSLFVGFLLGFTMMVWSEIVSIAWLEEFGRGFLIILIPSLILK